MSGPPIPAQFIQPQSMQPYGSPGPYGGMPQPAFAYGIDPLTGQMVSDKSKVVAGLLQLLPGGLFTIGGIGRLYAGNVGLGVAQLVATFVGWVSFFCGFLLVLPFFITFACWAWFVIDGIVMLAGRPLDGQGRPLRA